MLKRWLTVALVPAFLLAALVGCESRTVEGPGGKKLTLSKPADQTLRQGGTNDVRISITRDNFRDAVTVRFENLPEGVQVMDRDKKIAAEDKSGTFTLKADDTAPPVENHEVKVTAEGPDGMKVTEPFKLTVKPRS